LTDYWQFRQDSDTNWSGIGESQVDMTLLGQMITRYELAHDPKTHEALPKGERNPQVDSLLKHVSADRDLIGGIASYLTRSETIPLPRSDASKLSSDLADFMLQVHKDANRITEWIQAQPPRKGCGAPAVKKQAAITHTQGTEGERTLGLPGL
jgi:hypothetical protein